jgi:chromosome segregation ATPase
MVVTGSSSRGKYFHELVLGDKKSFAEVLDGCQEFVDFADAKEQKIEAARKRLVQIQAELSEKRATLDDAKSKEAAAKNEAENAYEPDALVLETIASSQEAIDNLSNKLTELEDSMDSAEDCNEVNVLCVGLAKWSGLHAKVVNHRGYAF